MAERADTRNDLLDIAQHLVQERGFNAISYADLSARLGIRNASVHYHFPSKADLGVALVQRYRARLERQLAQLDTTGAPPAERLRAYLHGYRAVVHEDGRICLCAVLAGDYNTLPEAMQREVRAFFDLNERWLTQVLTEGRARGDLRYPGAPQDAASSVLATLEGAMLLARSYRDPGRFHAAGQRLLDALTAA